MKKQVKLCLTMPLRDYAAFEDLASQLGVSITDITIANDVPVAKTQMSRKRKIFPTTAQF